MELAVWEADRTKLPCDKCIGMKKKKGKIPNCQDCKPVVLDENLPVLYLIEQFITTMFTETGLSAEGISLALSEVWVRKEDKSNFARRIIIYLNSLRAASRIDK